MQAGQQESTPASKLSFLAEEGAGRLSAATKRRLRDLLHREHRTHNTYRYNPQELAAVRDIVHELEVRWGTRVIRNDVMRAALIWVVEDFKERGQDSLLAQVLGEED